MQEENGKRFIDARELPCDEWLTLIDVHQDDRAYEIIDYEFPTDEIADECLAKLADWPEAKVLNLLRHFLLQGGGLGADRRLLDFWLQSGLVLEAVKLEFTKRMLNSDRHTWEGNTWVIDLLPDYPQKAVDAIDAYLTAHIQLLPDGRFRGLQDAMAVIRRRYFERQHPQQILMDLGHRDFEHLVGALYQRMGYDVEVTQPTVDGGLDVIARRTESGAKELLLIECKRFQATVGVPVVRALLGVVDLKHATKGVLVSNSNFSRHAENFAADTSRLELIGGHDLIRLFNRFLGSNWPDYLDTHISALERAKRIREVREAVAPKP